MTATRPDYEALIVRLRDLPVHDNGYIDLSDNARDQIVDAIEQLVRDNAAWKREAGARMLEAARYAAVIAQARDVLGGHGSWLDKAIAADRILSSVDPDAVLASRDAGKWDEGARAQADTYGMQVDAGPNPYRAAVKETDEEDQK